MSNEPKTPVELSSKADQQGITKEKKDMLEGFRIHLLVGFIYNRITVGKFV